MRALFTIFILFQTTLVLPVWATNWSPKRLCPLQKRFFQDRYTQRLSTDELAMRIGTKAPQAILLGENHGEKGNLYYPILLRKLKRALPDLDCVTFEVIPQIYPDNFGGRPAWESLAAEAARLGLSALKIDACDLSAQKNPDFICLDGRNKTMARNISRLLRAGSCSRIFHVGGSFHLVDLQRSARQHLAQRLRDGGISTFTIQLIDTELERASLPLTALAQDDPWRWGYFKTRKAVCKEWPGVPSENFTFLTAGSPLAAQVPVFYRPEIQSRMIPWSAFDAALVLGCPRDESDRCDIAAVPGYLVAE